MTGTFLAVLGAAWTELRLSTREAMVNLGLQSTAAAMLLCCLLLLWGLRGPR